MDSDCDSDVGEDYTKYRNRLFGRSGLVYWECVHKGNAARLKRILRSGSDLKLLVTQNDDPLEVYLFHCLCAQRKFDVFQLLLNGRDIVNAHLGNHDPIQWARVSTEGTANTDVRVSSLAYLAHLTDSRYALEALRAEDVVCCGIVESRTVRTVEVCRDHHHGAWPRLKKTVQRMVRRSPNGSKDYSRDLHVMLFNAVERGEADGLKRLCETVAVDTNSDDEVLKRYVALPDPRRETVELLRQANEVSLTVQLGWCLFRPNLLEAALLRSQFALAEELWSKFGEIIQQSLEDRVHVYWLFLITLLSDKNAAFQWLLSRYPLSCLKIFCRRPIPTQQPKSLLSSAAELGNVVILHDLLEIVTTQFSEAEKKAAVIQAVFASVLSCQGRSIEVLMPTFLLLADIGTKAALLEMAINLQSRSILAVLLCFLEDINIQIDNGQTLLHAAAVFDWPDGARMLLRAGLDQNAKDTRGRKPFDCATLHSRDVQAVFENFQRLSLFELCLIAVRKTLRPYVAGRAETLPLPDSLKRAVLYHRRRCTLLQTQ